RKKEEGKAKYIGFSFHDTANVLEQYLIEYPYIDYVQLQINYLDWLDPLVQSKKCYEVCLKHRKPVMVMEPIKGGSLINVPKEVEELFKSKSQKMSVASWAIRFVASLDNVKMVLSGMNSLEQLEDNMSYMTDFNPLDDDELSTIEQARELIRKSIAVPCTGCRYCVSENICPMNIAIPEYFRALNAKLGRYDVNGSKPKEYYQRTSAVHGLAGDCIECGGCEEKCPQHIKIRDYLKEVQKEFERLGE
ncbi:MAG: aldo/keto reductase, partial [Erysipelotrichaceae bacterium]|nr:aldo/keto reductase [Erysipelotrichaceae bacterium]